MEAFAQVVLRNHPYREFAHRLAKPARYLGGEYNQVVKDWSAVRGRVALAFPDVYDIAMSHLGFKILYKILNGCPDILSERVCAPWFDLEKELRARGLPLVSLESARPLRDFDVVGFSLQYEMTFTNLLNMIDLGGIPLRADRRTRTDPLVIAGGPVAFHAECLAPFLDAMVIGDGEEIFPLLCRTWAGARERGVEREQALRELAALPGVYVPSLYETGVDERTGLGVVTRPRFPEAPEVVRRAWVDNIGKYPFPTDSPVPATEAVFDRLSVEIARGCTEGCRFCQAGMIYRPVRERSPDEIINTVLKGLEEGGYDEASLTTLSTADFSCVSPLVKTLMDELAKRKVALGVSSLRAYGLSEELLDSIARVRAPGLTFAPEAGTQRMRDVITKNISEEDIERTARRVFNRGYQKMKLYFMIGLPTETDEDVAGILNTGAKVREIGRGFMRDPEITVSVSSHVPKPFTPFQWCAMDSLDELRRKQDILRRLQKLNPHIRLKTHDARVSHLEGIIARGDRVLSEVLEAAWRNGARFDGWDEHLDWDAWMNAFRDQGVDRQVYLRTLPVDARLPWSHLDCGVEQEFLAREYRRALKSRLSPPCGKPAGMQVHHTNLKDHEADQRKLVCYHCGVACDLTKMREERADFLEQLGAAEPPPETPLASRPRKDRKRPAPLAPQGAAQVWRIEYAKTGRAAFAGHLDMVRMIPRVFRRAGLELRYSEGFHPKPDISFGPALPLGVESVAEMADVPLLQSITGGELLERLNRKAGEGLVFTRAARAPFGSAGLNKLTRAAVWLVSAGDAAWSAALAMAGERFPGAGGAAELIALLARETRAAGVVLDVINHKGEAKQVDLAGTLIDARAAGPAPTLLALEAGAPRLELVLRLDAPNAARPVHYLGHWFGWSRDEGALARTACGVWREGVMVSPFHGLETAVFSPVLRAAADPYSGAISGARAGLDAAALAG